MLYSTHVPTPATPAHIIEVCLGSLSARSSIAVIPSSVKLFCSETWMVRESLFCFIEIHIITLNSIISRVESELKACGIKATLNIVGIDDSGIEDNFGTANSLYLLKDKLIRDCMIVSCDLILNVNVQQMANFYRNNSASFMMLMSDNV